MKVVAGGDSYKRGGTKGCRSADRIIEQGEIR
jgi:hypothetical protein